MLHLGRKWEHSKYSSTEEEIIEIWYTNAEVYFTSIKKNEMIKFTGESMGLIAKILNKIIKSRKINTESVLEFRDICFEYYDNCFSLEYPYR